MASKSENNNKKTKSGAKAKTSAKTVVPAKKNTAVKKTMAVKAKAVVKKKIKEVAKVISKVKAKIQPKKATTNKVVAKKAAPAKPVAIKKVAGKSASTPANKIKVQSPVKSVAKALAKQVIAKAAPAKAKTAVKSAPAKAITPAKAAPAKADVPVKSVPAKAAAAQKKEAKPAKGKQAKVVAPVKQVPEKRFVPVKPKSEREPEPERYAIAPHSKYIRFELEYPVRASTKLLFEFLTSPSGLSEWFADDVNITRDGLYTFFWEGTEQKAQLVTRRENNSIKFRWIEEPKDTFFEFRIQVDDLTSDVALIITDFAEDNVAIAASKLLWDAQVNSLLHAIGSY